MTLTPEQIQVIRAATCDGCRAGFTLESHEGPHRKPGGYQNQWKRVPCTAATDMIAVVESWLDFTIEAQVQAARVSAAGAVREQASQHRFQKFASPIEKDMFSFTCVCGVVLAEDNPADAWEEHIRSLPLATDDNGAWLKAHDAKLQDALDNESTHNVLLQNEVKQLKQQLALARLDEARWWDVYIDEHIQKYGKEWHRTRGKDRVAELEAKLAAGEQTYGDIVDSLPKSGRRSLADKAAGEQEPK